MRVLQGASATRTDEMLKALVGRYRYGRYCQDRHLPLERSQAYEWHRIHTRMQQPETVAFWAMSSEDEPVGLLVGHHSSWDSEHFEYEVAVIDYCLTADLGYEADVDSVLRLLGAFHEWCHDHAIRFVSARVPSLQLEVLHALEATGYRYIESYISNVFDLHKLEDSGEELPSPRIASPEEKDLMAQHAQGAFAGQRFHADPFIDKAKADALYEKWIESAFADANREVLVFELDHKPAAWAVCFPQDLRQFLGIRSVTTQVLLVAPEARGAGFGVRYMKGLFKHYQKAGVDVIDSGVTMRNLASVNWHNKLGFRVVSVETTFHKWFS